MTSARMAACLGLLVLSLGCGREVSPEQVALDYARALYAGDLAQAYWAEGIRVSFRTQVAEGLPLRAVPEPHELLAMRGDTVRMAVRVTNSSGRDLSVRVGHVIEPKTAASSLAFVQCPLLLPLRLRSQEARERI